LTDDARWGRPLPAGLGEKPKIGFTRPAASCAKTHEARAVKIKDRPEFASKPQAFALQGRETVASAVKAMVERNIGSVVIVDADTKVQGIVTERDILRFVAENLDPKATPLSRIMSTQIKTAKLDDDDMEWLQHMSEERFRHLPIVEENGRLIGILSQGDFVAQTWQDLLLLVRRKTEETLKKPTAQVVGALVLYTLVIIVMSRFWQGFSFR
jgi:signal-transduction protein with cAMP-binding, CBS, and nucleotidyltransferase domain